MLHIGQLIKVVFARQTKDRNINWFAIQMHCQRANVYKIFHKRSLDIQQLWKISKILDYDFFADLSQEFKHNQQNDPLQTDEHKA